MDILHVITTAVRSFTLLLAIATAPQSSVAVPQSSVAVPQTGAVITGSITDPDGAPMPGAFVHLESSDPESALDVVSDTSGTYTFAVVKPGTYTLSVNLPGMRSHVQPAVVVVSGDTRRIDVRLQDGPSLRTLGEDPATLLAIFVNRPPPPEGPAPRTADGRPDLSGVWLSGPVRPIGEMLPSAEALMKERSAPKWWEYPPARCLPRPIPLFGGGFFQIVQGASMLVMTFEGDSPGVRHVFLDRREHPTDFGPTWLGHSIGRWNGDILTIDSVGFHDRGWLDSQGYPHSDRLHVIQKIKRPSLGSLEIEITVDDPGAYRQAWTISKSASLVIDDEIREYICNENNKAPALTK